MKLQLAIAVKEQEYARRLADYIRDSPFGGKWQLTAFTHPEAFVHFLKGGYPVDFIAAQPSMLKTAESFLPNVPTAVLVGGDGGSAEFPELRQFQPLPELLHRIAALYADSGGMSRQKAEEGASVLAVYSASGGVGKTTLCLQLMNAAGAAGYRAFYLNLERWNAMEAWLGKEAGSSEGEGLSQLLYLLKAQPEKVNGWLLQHRKRHSALKGDYLPAFSNADDRMTLQAADAEAIVKAVAASGQYDLIVIDMDEALDELHVALYERSDQIVWLLTDDPSVKRKSELACRYGSQRWGSRFQAVERRFQFVVNRRSGGSGERLPQRDWSEARPIAAALPECEAGSIQPQSVIAAPQYKAAVERLFRQLMKEGGGDRLADG
ncbi:hypothetical protein [Paenibacillus radicis (ex Gao et al. 2016)]|uniref:AAA domain-containing protein n=1 Tax=Paenibacillus radicis (ex Gao et al. 2016) TaxID=1737354 RepID=A0A917HEJ0_9BACL|nr:hypothetical protein [Paenibacillus radicis (ex Gao et al. 2016)]GGG76537.1 hypothetical protein GCM10010918_36330 [Paenibacillus radicis (ex Gao et al. 2016)]